MDLIATGKSFLTAICSKVARGSTEDSILSISATERANLLREKCEIYLRIKLLKIFRRKSYEMVISFLVHTYFLGTLPGGVKTVFQ